MHLLAERFVLGCYDQAFLKEVIKAYLIKTPIMLLLNSPTFLLFSYLCLWLVKSISSTSLRLYARHHGIPVQCFLFLHFSVYSGSITSTAASIGAAGIPQGKLFTSYLGVAPWQMFSHVRLGTVKTKMADCLDFFFSAGLVTLVMVLDTVGESTDQTLLPVNQVSKNKFFNCCM